MKRILLIGSGAREHAIAKTIHRSSYSHKLFCFGSHSNPGIQALAEHYETGSMTDVQPIVQYAKKHSIDFTIIGPEAPLAAGVVDALNNENIQSIGPTQKLAQIETSKGFTRDLLKQHDVPGTPLFQRFHSLDGIKDYLNQRGDAYVVKADGLMGGKGVKVAGEHLHSHDDALHYCQEILEKGQSIVIEEKLDGEEFSLISFSDGKHLIHMPVVQDHKRAFEKDTGPNTGGMGSYTNADHRLPFLSSTDITLAQDINEQTIRALYNEFNEPYIGFLYGGFMATKEGVKLIEYNARFGDPEAMNLLCLLDSDFLDICDGILNQTLNQLNVQFKHQATVCKYLVPNGYPDQPTKGETIKLDSKLNQDMLFYASVTGQNSELVLLGSRAIAMIGIANTLEDAERDVEQQIRLISGPVFHRPDIGTADLINQRIFHMNQLRNKESALL